MASLNGRTKGNVFQRYHVRYRVDGHAVIIGWQQQRVVGIALNGCPVPVLILIHRSQTREERAVLVHADQATRASVSHDETDHGLLVSVRAGDRIEIIENVLLRCGSVKTSAETDTVV